MNIVFVSNYVTHHTAALGQELCKLLDGGFAFVETRPREAAADAFRMGYAYSMAGENGDLPWVISGWQEPEQARRLILEADAVVTANCPDSWVLPRLKARGLTFRAHERWYRTPLKWYKRPRAVLGGWLHHGRFPSLYLLASSAYASADAAKVGCFRGRAYRWGYFPAFRDYADALPEKTKDGDVPVVLWAGRMVKCKRAEDALAACGKLWAEGCRFRLRMAGSGPEEERLRALAGTMGENVSFLGVLSPERLRDEMERGDVFLFTSDFQEGWGAVVNEAMNSACAVVASHAAGAVPYLIRDGENGLIYPCGDVAALVGKLRRLVDSPALRRELGMRACETIRAQWSPAVAACRLVSLCGDLINGRQPGETEGPCSAAPILKNDWYKECEP